MGTSPPVRVHPDACGSGSRPVANFLFARSGLWMFPHSLNPKTPKP